MQSRLIGYYARSSNFNWAGETIVSFKAFSREILVVDAVCSGGAVLINNSKVYLRKISSVSTSKELI